MNNEEFIENDDIFLEENDKPAFTEKVKNIFEVICNKIYTLRCICCFTSLLALLGIIFPFTDQIYLPDFIGYAVLLGWLIGVLSGIIACPLKMGCTVIAIFITGVSIGAVFLGIGAIFGFMIALIISLLMILVFPSVIAIPHYFKELHYDR
ncbi:MAG: hypothetical protein IKT46_10180 [Clostridia bacterium]|nr:hypothetical protein [Clostridia bacterium]